MKLLRLQSKLSLNEELLSTPSVTLKRSLGNNYKVLGVSLRAALYAHTPAGLGHRPVSAAIANAESRLSTDYKPEPSRSKRTRLHLPVVSLSVSVVRKSP